MRRPTSWCPIRSARCDRRRLIAAASAQIEANGGLDVLVNNAGIGMVALNGPDALRMFDTNAFGMIRSPRRHSTAEGVGEPCRRQHLGALGSFWANHEPSRPASKYPAIVYGASKAAVSMSRPVRAGRAGSEVQRGGAGYTATELGGVQTPAACRSRSAPGTSSGSPRSARTGPLGRSRKTTASWAGERVTTTRSPGRARASAAAW